MGARLADVGVSVGSVGAGLETLGLVEEEAGGAGLAHVLGGAGGAGLGARLAEVLGGVLVEAFSAVLEALLVLEEVLVVAASADGVVFARGALRGAGQALTVVEVLAGDASGHAGAGFVQQEAFVAARALRDQGPSALRARGVALLAHVLLVEVPVAAGSLAIARLEHQFVLASSASGRAGALRASRRAVRALGDFVAVVLHSEGGQWAFLQAAGVVLRVAQRA